VRAGERAVGERDQVLAIGVLAQWLSQREQLRPRDPATLEGDLLGAGDLQTLALLDRLDEVRRLQKRFVRPGIQPRIAATEALDHELAALQVAAVEIGDLELATRRGREGGGIIRG